MAKKKKKWKRRLLKTASILPVVGAFTSGELEKDAEKYGKKKGYGAGVLAGVESAKEDPGAELERRMETYRTAGDRAKTAAESDARRAGTWADTDAYRTSLTGEASARTRGIQSEELNRINALRKQLGMPEAAPGAI